MHDFVLTLAGVPLRCRPRFANTADYFEAFAPALDFDPAAAAAAAAPAFARVAAPGGMPSAQPKPAPGAQTAPLPVNPESPIGIPDQDWAEYLSDGMEDTAHGEYSMLTYYLSDALLPFDRVVMHGVALRWRDRAWLICAPSGVGKSTQLKHLCELRPGEFTVISGDRPVLEFRPPACHSERSEESVPPVSPVAAHSVRQSATPRHSERSEESVPPAILVHPSPWNGKENWHGAKAAPLAGLILLERGPENRLAALTDREAMIPLYPCFLQSCWDPDNIRRVAALETRLLRAVPIWKLTTHQVPDSTRLLLEAVFSE